MLPLHPHVPPGIKDFSKHLLAMFLGLLMALGLEQWREKRAEANTAEEFLSRVEEEIRSNREGTERTLRLFDASLKSDRELLTALNRALVDSEPRGASIQKRDARIRQEYYFTTSAWDAAKAAGITRSLPPDRALSLAGLYGHLEMLQQYTLSQLSNTHSTNFLALYTEDWDRLSREDLIRLRDSVRYITNTNENWVLIGKSLLPEFDYALNRGSR